MEVARIIKVETEKFEVGDRIEIYLKKFGAFTATAQRIGKDGTIFMFDSIVKDCRMNNSETNNSFECSDLCRWIRTALLDSFPDDLKARIKDISIPTYGQIFGHDENYDLYKLSIDNDEQFPLMIDGKNRIAFIGDAIDWYWLQNTTYTKEPPSYFAVVDCDDVAYYDVSSAYFAFVDGYGGAYYSIASASGGVRPVFLLG